MSEKLIVLRNKIDQIDDQILSLLKKRISCMGKIGEIKKMDKLSIRDDKREKEKMKVIEQKGEKLGISLGLVTQVWTILFKQSEEIEK
ncbi:chorismate mutase [Patescibacteria group bacterium]|nr:chorismate mutase [Patescibacteria group bacterium]